MYICAWQAPELPPDALISSRITLAAVRPRPAPPYSSGISAASQPSSVSAPTNSSGIAVGLERRASTRPGSARRARARRRGSRPAPGGREVHHAGLPLEQPAGDDQLLDLVRALADQEQRRVAVVALGAELERVAVAAVDAHRVERVVLRRLGREVLRHPGLEVGALAARLRCAACSDEQPRRLGARRHLREHQLHGLVVADLLAERLALLRVAERVVERRLRDPGAARGDVDAADLDPAHEVLEPLADAGLAAEHARRRRAEAVEDELGRLDALVAELLQRRASGS